ncbi:MAG: saccharopine dehydrogenase NADP-binding domain-containing protein, partial [Cyanobacteria bacterium P01_D01_bin.6]
MDKKRTLIVGGYGTVGSVVSEILARDERFLPVISGRNASKARELAHKLQVEWRTIDINDEQSIVAALPNIDLIVNCFSGPFTHSPLRLPELSAKYGINYLDVSGSHEYTERFLKLNGLALKNNVALVTALGANPGIPGIALMSAKDDFDEMESGRIVFVLGAELEGISIPALKEMKHMFDVKPLMWKQSEWIKPKKTGKKEYVGKPFEKEVYLGSFLTADLLAIPKLTGIDELSSWSGSQSMSQGLVMLVGLKLGLTQSQWGAQLLLNVMKQMG